MQKFLAAVKQLVADLALFQNPAAAMTAAGVVAGVLGAFGLDYPVGVILGALGAVGTVAGVVERMLAPPPAPVKPLPVPPAQPPAAA
jgi:hypothetical protein